MTVTTVFATPPGGTGSTRSGNATYAIARTGGTFVDQGSHLVGQLLSGSYFCLESHLLFDTSGLPDTDSVSAVVLSLDGGSDSSTTDFTVRVGTSAYDGGQVTSTDWVSGASLPSPVLATWDTSGYNANYNAFTETADFKTAINLTGNTAIMLWSSLHEAGTPPTGNEFLSFQDADVAGTTADPKLDITHDAAAGGTTPFLMLMGVGT